MLNVILIDTYVIIIITKQKTVVPHYGTVSINGWFRITCLHELDLKFLLYPVKLTLD
jgi:hypothetical protein